MPDKVPAADFFHPLQYSGCGPKGKAKRFLLGAKALFRHCREGRGSVLHIFFSTIQCISLESFLEQQLIMHHYFKNHFARFFVRLLFFFFFF